MKTECRLAAIGNSQGAASKPGHLTAKTVEGKMLAEDLSDIGKRK